jgi:hypothetical protein
LAIVASGEIVCGLGVMYVRIVVGGFCMIDP